MGFTMYQCIGCEVPHTEYVESKDCKVCKGQECLSGHGGEGDPGKDVSYDDYDEEMGEWDWTCHACEMVQWREESRKEREALVTKLTALGVVCDCHVCLIHGSSTVDQEEKVRELQEKKEKKDEKKRKGEKNESPAKRVKKT
jgi:hypothetical protein